MNYKSILNIGLLAGVMAACTPVEKVGPDICPSDDFSLSADDLVIEVLSGGSSQSLQAAGGDVDLSSEGLNLTADFGEEVDWTLKLSNGTQTKMYSGTSDTIDIFWYGQADKFEGKMQFDAGTVTAELSVVCFDAVSKTFALSGTQNFKDVDNRFGVLIRDWDQNGAYPVAGTTYDDGADGWAGKGGGVDTWVFDYFDATPSPSGGLYAQFHGAGTDGLWYLGSHSITVTDFEDLLPADQIDNVDNIYLNFFVSAEAGAVNTGSQIAVKDNSGDSFLGLEDINWTGWKLLSYKLSDLKTNSGEKLSNTNLTDFVLQLGAQPEQSNDLKVKYDFMMLTIGAPLFTE